MTTLIEFLNKVNNNYKIEYEDLSKSEDFFTEISMLEALCEEKKLTKKLIKAWDVIIENLSEEYFTDKILKYLVDNNIELITLGHKNLPDDWLLKIYEKDNRCIEALKTLELRHKVDTVMDTDRHSRTE